MNERALEILVRLCPDLVFGEGWRLLAQQLSLASGRIDLLLADQNGNRQLLELKKGRATRDAVTQGLRYAFDLSKCLDDAPVTPWIVAHEIPDAIANFAESQGVLCKAISLGQCESMMALRGITESDLIGPRRSPDILHGGNGGIWRLVDGKDAYSAMPPNIAAALQRIDSSASFLVRSGAMQSMVHYRGVKLGGVNRKDRGGHCYISNGVVLRTDFELFLQRFGFCRMRKTQKGSSHEHSWWEISWDQAESFEAAVNRASVVVDHSLGVTQ